MLSNNHLRHRLPVFHLRYGLTALAKLNFCIFIISLLYLFLRFTYFFALLISVFYLFLCFTYFCVLLISAFYLFLHFTYFFALPISAFSIFCIIRLDVALLFLAMVLFFIPLIASIYHSPVSGSTVYLSFSFLSIARARL